MIEYMRAVNDLHDEYAPWSYLADVIGVVIGLAVYQFGCWLWRFLVDPDA